MKRNVPSWKVKFDSHRRSRICYTCLHESSEIEIDQPEKVVASQKSNQLAPIRSILKHLKAFSSRSITLQQFTADFKASKNASRICFAFHLKFIVIVVSYIQTIQRRSILIASFVFLKLLMVLLSECLLMVQLMQPSRKYIFGKFRFIQ